MRLKIQEHLLRPFIQLVPAVDEITVVTGIWGPMTSARTCAPVVVMAVRTLQMKLRIYFSVDF